MTQTFIDMLVAIKDPVAIEKAYNILAAKREMLLVDAKQKFQHSVMEPKPIQPTYSQFRLEQEQEQAKGQARNNGISAGDYVEVKGVNRVMQLNGLCIGQQFRVIRRPNYKPEQYVIAKSLYTGNLATIHVDYLKRIHPVITF